MSSLYVHIPFCAKRCFYCDFHSGTDVSLRDAYVDALALELNSRIGELRGEHIDTVYIGGGTPSQLSVEQLIRLFGMLQTNINLSECDEVTMEINPDDVTSHFVSHLKRLPINRISMGVQSFSNRLLAVIGRRHNAQTAIDAYNMLRDAGYDNISLDLMFSLPTQTMEEWEESVDKMLSLLPEHISAYDLSYEEGSVLTEKLRRGEFSACTEDLSVAMYDRLVSLLCGAGYEHYEISNFAKPGYRSKHNSSYWCGIPYLGLGASAHSYDGCVRRANISNTREYISKINSGNIAYETEELTPEDIFNETIFTRIRTLEGISLKEVADRFGQKNLQHLLTEAASYIKSGDLKECNGYLSLTRKGILISDAICCNLFL